MSGARDETANAIRILETLVSFDTTSRHSNLALIEWVEAYLAARGIASQRVANGEGTKSNLYAVVGPAVPGGVVLSGHSDVVPVDGQPWTSDPWVVTQKGSKLYGRGVADMKSFLALSLAHVDAALEAGVKKPLILAFSYDEEVGCLGAPDMIRELKDAVPTPAAVIVGEPTDMKVVSGHKGISTFNVVVTGREAHSSQVDQGVSAVMEAVKLMGLIAEIGRAARAGADPASPFVPPGATLTIGLVEGGTAVNILARRCAFTFDLRSPDAGETERIVARFMAAAEALDAEIKARAPEGGVQVTRRSSSPGLLPDAGSAAEALARALTGDNDVNVASYAAEAGLFQQAGMAAVLCGPGSILQAHQPDEWIERDQIAQGAAFMRRLIARLSV